MDMHKKEILIGNYRIRIQSSVANDGWVWQVHERKSNMPIAQAWNAVPSVDAAIKAARAAIPNKTAKPR